MLPNFHSAVESVAERKKQGPKNPNFCQSNQVCHTNAGVIQKCKNTRVKKTKGLLKTAWYEFFVKLFGIFWFCTIGDSYLYSTNFEFVLVNTSLILMKDKMVCYAS